MSAPHDGDPSAVCTTQTGYDKVSLSMHWSISACHLVVCIPGQCATSRQIAGHLNLILQDKGRLSTEGFACAVSRTIAGSTPLGQSYLSGRTDVIRTDTKSRRTRAQVQLSSSCMQTQLQARQLVSTHFIPLHSLLLDLASSVGVHTSVPTVVRSQRGFCLTKLMQSPLSTDAHTLRCRPARCSC